MTLTDDISRCHDEECQVKNRCERWLQRDTGSASTTHCTTLRPMWQVFSEPCDHAIGTFEEEPHKFPLGTEVRKISGSSWQGKVVGFYSTELTPVGYCVESSLHPGSVQIYPEKALEAICS